jgi:hypothetical protein
MSDPDQEDISCRHSGCEYCHRLGQASSRQRDARTPALVSAVLDATHPRFSTSFANSAMGEPLT